MPDILLDRIAAQATWAPPWLVGVAVILVALAAALPLHAGIVKALSRGLRRRSEFSRSLLARTRGPGRLALMFFAAWWAVQIAPLTHGATLLIQRSLLVAWVVLCGWVLITAIDIASAIYMRRFRTDVANNALARKHLTQVRILRRAAATLIGVVTVAMALMTIPAVRQVGISLLAAGGAAGIIVGLALQPLLSNLLAGVQLALTQPIRLDDAVVIEGEFGNVEEIKATYVVVRLWDLRRMVVPLKYFLEKPFQNWTRESAELLGTVMLYVDYAVGIGTLRERFREIVQSSRLWDGKTAVLQVTDARERTMEVRCLVSAADSGKLFDLRVEVREKMVAFLQAEMPGALPRDRIEVLPLRSDAQSLQ